MKYQRISIIMATASDGEGESVMKKSASSAKWQHGEKAKAININNACYQAVRWRSIAGVAAVATATRRGGAFCDCAEKNEKSKAAAAAKIIAAHMKISVSIA